MSEFVYSEDAVIDLYEWIHLKHQPEFFAILVIYRLQMEENFELYRDFEARQFSLGLIAEGMIDPNPQSFIDLTPDEGLEF